MHQTHCNINWVGFNIFSGLGRESGENKEGEESKDNFEGVHNEI